MRKISNFKAILLLFSAFLSTSLIFIGCSKENDIQLQPLEIESARGGKKTAVQIDAAKTELGKRIFFDNRLSEPIGMQSCASCHLPSQGFFGFGDVTTGSFPRGFVDGFAEGAAAGRFGGRRAPSAAYATFSPVMVFKNGNGAADEFVGGLFWDGRATGHRLNNTAAEQALGPFLNPVEQNHPSSQAVLEKIKANVDNYYGTLWQTAWGADISTATTADINTNYDRVGFAIAAFEASSEVNQFSSKFDAYLRGQATLTAEEQLGLALFEGDAKCDGCHSSRALNIPQLFTDFGYDNLGLPGSNSPHALKPDPGLGGFLSTFTSPDANKRQWQAMAPDFMGKFKTPTLRNVAKGTNKRFMHNGIFTSLEQVVHFYNTRDVPGAGWNGVPWGAPEFPATMEVGNKIGNLLLTAADEAALVAFMKTLSDGFTAPQGN